MAGFTGFHAEIDEAALNDLVFFCGTDQIKDPTPEFLMWLRDIAARAGHKILPTAEPGLDVKIPTQVACNDPRSIRAGQLFTSILNAETVIKELWNAYEQRTGNRGVETGTIRCTLELGPMIAELTNSLGQVVTAAFDWERRSPRRAITRLFSDRGIYLRDGSPLQVNHVEFTLYTGMMMADFLAIMSAMAINQTVKKFSIRGEKRAVTHADQWKWLAYGLFSKRARVLFGFRSRGTEPRGLTE
ncbi:hypothetical protein GQ600_1971 [Phytophthora cactorum]|nr:hypothetical protein GQ600_1971 [Phytophthora cactorum]